MKIIKKPVSILLALMMVVGLFSAVPFTADAAFVVNDDFTLGTDGTVFIIKNAAGWNTFCANVNSGESFSGKTVMLNGNIGTAANPVTASAGSAYRRSFSGTFDGGGNRLYFEGSAANPAPFAFLVGTESDPASVSNLNVVSTTGASDSDVVAGLVSVTAGYAEVTDCDVDVQLTTSIGTNNPTDLFTAGLVARAEDHLTVSGCSVSGEIATNGKCASGLVGKVLGTADIENCMSDVTINSSVGGEGGHGGLVGQVGQTGTLNLTGCVFNGKLLTTGSVDTRGCGGLLGMSNKNNCTITSCIYDPALVESGEKEAASGSCTIYTGKTAAVVNCYYTRTLGIAQGKQAREITAGENVIFHLSGEETEYDVSGIMAFEGNSGLWYNDIYYAGAGDEVSLTLDHAAAPTGYTFNGYTASAGTLENNVLTMPAGDVCISASFVKTEYNITVADTDHGTVTAPQTAHYEDTVTLTVQPDMGFLLKTLTVTDEDDNEIEVTNNQFTMPDKAVTVTAEFELIKTEVIINSVDINGIATPTTVYAETYTSADYTVPASPYLDGYTFSGWKVNDVLKETEADVQTAVYNLVKAETPVTVAVVYTKIDAQHTVTVNAPTTVGCTIKDANGNEIAAGTSVNVSEQLYAVADQAAPDQHFAYWVRIQGDKQTIVGYETTYAFHMPDEDVTLTAIYTDSETPIEKVGTAYIESVKRTAENKLSFVSKVSVPEGARMR